MADWELDELEAFAAAEEITVTAARADGRTPAVPIWAVRVGGALFARAAYGTRSGWWVASRKAGWALISAGGGDRPVTVIDAHDLLADEIDQAYRDKYGAKYASIVDQVNAPSVRANTVEFSPMDGVTGAG